MPSSTLTSRNERRRNIRPRICAAVTKVSAFLLVATYGQRNCAFGLSTSTHPTTTTGGTLLASRRRHDGTPTAAMRTPRAETRLQAHARSRREAIAIPIRRAAAAAAPWAMPPAFSDRAIANAAEGIGGGGGGLAAKLSKRDASVLKNSMFNIPPAAQVYPPFLRGRWDVTMRFRGFLFPSTTIAKEKLVANFAVPGFQKCSIAAVCDVGREETRYVMDVDPATGLEDRRTSLQTSIDAHLGYAAVRDVVYDRSSNPNRLSVDFVPNRTRNANRIELFCNARESELVASREDSPGKFVCSEYVRQVTFGLSQEFGVARQVVGNYAHFWTWRAPSTSEGSGNSSTITGNLLTAVYLDPQDAMFFDEPSKPVVVYSHDLVARRASS